LTAASVKELLLAAAVMVAIAVVMRGILLLFREFEKTPARIWHKKMFQI
jgi:hypothetical protein